MFFQLLGVLFVARSNLVRASQKTKKERSSYYSVPSHFCWRDWTSYQIFKGGGGGVDGGKRGVGGKRGAWQGQERVAGKEVGDLFQGWVAAFI